MSRPLCPGRPRAAHQAISRSLQGHSGTALSSRWFTKTCRKGVEKDRTCLYKELSLLTSDHLGLLDFSGPCVWPVVPPDGCISAPLWPSEPLLCTPPREGRHALALAPQILSCLQRKTIYATNLCILSPLYRAWPLIDTPYVLNENNYEMCNLVTHFRFCFQYFPHYFYYYITDYHHIYYVLH